MFDLHLISEENFSTERNELIAIVEIKLGNFSEKFGSSLSFWKIEDYRKQWIEGANRILNLEQTAFITDMFNPETANFIIWWTAWKFGERIFVQNQILFFEQILEPFSLSDPYKFIGERTTKTEEGENISEWEISLTDIVNFLKSNEK